MGMIDFEIQGLIDSELQSCAVCVFILRKLVAEFQRPQRPKRPESHACRARIELFEELFV